MRACARQWNICSPRKTPTAAGAIPRIRVCITATTPRGLRRAQSRSFAGPEFWAARPRQRRSASFSPAIMSRTARSALRLCYDLRFMQTGIVGLPQVGKTTLFRILTKAHLDEKAGRGATHVGVARVPEPRIDQLAALYK